MLAVLFSGFSVSLYLDLFGFGLSTVHAFACRSWQAPRAVVQADEGLWADQLQPSITYIAGIVQVGPSCHLDLSMFYCGRRPTGLS